jgi:UrcA family protein
MKITTQNTIRAAAILALGLFTAVTALAQPSTAATKLSLAGLDFSTTEGMSAARERVHQAARAACRRVSEDLDLSHQANFVKCVDDTMAKAFERLAAPRVAGSKPAITSPASGARAAASAATGGGSAPGLRKTVSLADLDLSTPNGARAAHDRLHEVARDVCSHAEDELDLSHQANFVACVDEAMAQALPRIEEMARRSAPNPIVVSDLSK